MTTQTVRKPRITTRRALATTLVSCAVAGAAFLGAAPANAAPLGGDFYGNLIGVTKVNPDGAPLAGAVLEVCAAPPAIIDDPNTGTNESGASMTEQSAVYRQQAIEWSSEYLVPLAQEALDAANVTLAAAQADFDFVADDLLDDAGRAAAQATIDAYAPIGAEQKVLDDAFVAANAVWQATVAEILALQEAGEPVPADLVEREAQEEAASQEAAAAAAVYRDAHVTEREAANAATDALDRDIPAQDAAAALEDAQNAFDGAAAALEDAESPRHDTNSAHWTSLANALDAQIERNIAAGISTDRTVDTDALFCYQAVSGEDGRVFVPTGVHGSATVEEIAAPAGYQKIDGVLTPSEDGAFTATGGTPGFGSQGGGIDSYDLVNQPEEPQEPEEPVEPPVEPEEPEKPVEPPVEEPEEPVKPNAPEKLAYTGSDSTAPMIAGGIAALAAAAGGALALLRRRSAA